MPHFCDTCGYEFSDGSDEMLSGCPDCGGRKFQYVAEGGTPPQSVTNPADSSGATDDSEIIEAGPEVSETSGSEDSAQHAARSGIIEPDDEEVSYTGSMSELVSGLQSKHDVDENDNAETADESVDASSVDGEGTEDDDGDELEGSEEAEPPSVPEGSEGVSGGESSRRVMSADDVREELQAQFESIKIREPGSYELNLKKLYEREEHIIQIKENGKYVIQMPER